MLDGLKRIVNSAKVQLLASGVVSAAVLYYFTDGTSADKRPLLKELIIAVAALMGAVILGWAHEDAAAKSQPQSQVNVGSRVDNTTTAVATAPVSEPPAPKPVEKKQAVSVGDALLAEIRALKKQVDAMQPSSHTVVSPGAVQQMPHAPVFFRPQPSHPISAQDSPST